MNAYRPSKEMEGGVRNLEIVWSIGQCWLGSEEVMALLLSVLFSSLAASFWLVLVYRCCFNQSLVRTFFIDNVSDVRVVAFEHAQVGICRFYESRLCP
jgi:hypothetical protein